jgi:vacuolar-type H+-ATPase subunit F/Vma7
MAAADPPGPSTTGVVAVIGELERVAAYALAGAAVLAAPDGASAQRQWASLAKGVAVVVLTPAAAAAVAGLPAPHRDLLTVVMP